MTPVDRPRNMMPRSVNETARNLPRVNLQKTVKRMMDYSNVASGFYACNFAILHFFI